MEKDYRQAQGRNAAAGALFNATASPTGGMTGLQSLGAPQVLMFF